MLTDSIIKQIESLGYAVSVFFVNGVTEMHAVKLSRTDEQHIARSLDGIEEKDRYQTACILAEMVGIEIDDG